MIDLPVSTSKSIDESKLPPKLWCLIYDYGLKKFPEIPPETLLISYLTKLSQVALLKRLKVRSNVRETFINLYSILFMPSGTGKDAPLVDFDEVFMQEYRIEFARNFDEYKRTALTMIEKRASEECKTEGEKAKFIRENKPRGLVDRFGDATIEGFYALREAYSLANWGGVMVNIEEFADYILTDNGTRAQLLTAIKEVYEGGSNDAKIIKSEKVYQGVSGVPTGFSARTSPAGLLRDRNKDKLMDFFNRGLARRCFVVYPTLPEKIKIATDSAAWDLIQLEAEESSKYLKEKVVDEMIMKTAYNKVYTFDPTAQEMLHRYRVQNTNESIKYRLFKEEGFVGELATRHSKAFRLAGLIAAIEHPDEYIIKESDVYWAIYIAELFGNHFKSFFEDQDDSPENRLLSYFVTNLNQWIVTMDIRNEKFVSKNRFKPWFNESLEEIKDFADSKNLFFAEEKVGKNGFRYMLADNPEQHKIADLLDVIDAGVLNAEK